MSFGTWRFKSSLVYHNEYQEAAPASFCYDEEMTFERELKIATMVAYEAGEIMRTYSVSDNEPMTKQDGTPVTVADTSINRMVIERLAVAFPGDVVVGEEESSGDYGRGRIWLCDPIDGTKAFTWGVPTAMFSLALVIDGKPVVGVCYEPMLDKLYTATRGEGSYCNSIPLRVNESEASKGIVAIASAPDDIRSNPIVGRILDAGFTTAVFSGAVYKAAAVADGRFAAYVEHKVNAYDIAAVDLIVTEAGGTVTGLDGKAHDYSHPIKGCVVTNSVCHQEIMRLVEGA